MWYESWQATYENAITVCEMTTETGDYSKKHKLERMRFWKERMLEREKQEEQRRMKNTILHIQER
jgi:hypothetical protein